MRPEVSASGLLWVLFDELVCRDEEVQFVMIEGHALTPDLVQQRGQRVNELRRVIEVDLRTVYRCARMNIRLPALEDTEDMHQFVLGVEGSMTPLADLVVVCLLLRPTQLRIDLLDLLENIFTISSNELNI